MTQIAQIRDERTYAIIGAAMEVHSKLGCGFLEMVYQEALAVEFALREIPFKREVALPLEYKGRKLDCAYRVDFICYDAVVVELKALTRLTTLEHSFVLNYLKSSGMEVGLLLNFGGPSLQYKRFVKSVKSAESADRSSPS